MYVRNWMTSPVTSTSPATTVREADLMMNRKKIRRLPVVRTGKLIGIVTRSDVRSSLGRLKEEARRKAGGIGVGEIMTKDPFTVSPKDTLDVGAQIMLKEKVSGLPVVEGGKLVGMLTESDVFYAMCTILGFTQKGQRVVLSLKRGEDLLTQLQKAVGTFSVEGIVSYYNPSGQDVEAIVRLRGRRKS